MKSLFILSLILALPQAVIAFPIDQLSSAAALIRAHGRTPVAVLDLDETLIHSALRKELSYLNALSLHQKELQKSFPNEYAKAVSGFRQQGEGAIRNVENQYDSAAIFRKFGIVNPEFVKVLDADMLPIYLSNQYIPEDTAYRGAVELVAAIYRAGGIVYFVTSRYSATQSTETQNSLLRLHLFANNQQSKLMMRNTGEASLDFKTRALQSIRLGLGTSGQVLMVAENEPENLNAMMQAFPHAFPVFVKGAILNQTVGLQNAHRILITSDFAR